MFLKLSLSKPRYVNLDLIKELEVLDVEFGVGILVKYVGDKEGTVYHDRDAIDIWNAVEAKS